MTWVLTSWLDNTSALLPLYCLTVWLLGWTWPRPLGLSCSLAVVADLWLARSCPDRLGLSPAPDSCPSDGSSVPAAPWEHGLWLSRALFPQAFLRDCFLCRLRSPHTAVVAQAYTRPPWITGNPQLHLCAPAALMPCPFPSCYPWSWFMSSETPPCFPMAIKLLWGKTLLNPDPCKMWGPTGLGGEAAAQPWECAQTWPCPGLLQLPGAQGPRWDSGLHNPAPLGSQWGQAPASHSLALLSHGPCPCVAYPCPQWGAYCPELGLPRCPRLLLIKVGWDLNDVGGPQAPGQHPHTACLNDTHLETNFKDGKGILRCPSSKFCESWILFHSSNKYYGWLSGKY